MENTVEEEKKAKLYTKYPFTSTLTYNGVTILHYLFGGIGIIVGYNFSWIAYLAGILYIAFALVQMYVLMPLMVCPNCVYYGLKDSRCISSLNLLSRKLTEKGDPKDFPNRGKGLFCHNNLYIASLFFPIVVMIPALVLNFSLALAVVFVIVVALLLYRFFIVFPRLACIHCRAKKNCPNAQAMGLHTT